MKNKTAKPKRPSPKRVLRLPDLDYAKTAVLNTLSSSDSRRSYRFAIDDFVTWYCSEPRLAFSKTVVLRYRLDLEGRRLAPSTINLRLAAVRRLAYEAADTGLLSPSWRLVFVGSKEQKRWAFDSEIGLPQNRPRRSCAPQTSKKFAGSATMQCWRSYLVADCVDP